MIGNGEASDNRHEMRRKPRLARLVVIRHDDQRRVGADIGRGPRHLDRMRAVELLPQPAITGTRPLATSTVPRYLPMLVGGQRRALAGRPARHERVAALGDLPLDELGECVLSDTAAAKMASRAPESSRKT